MLAFFAHACPFQIITAHVQGHLRGVRDHASLSLYASVWKYWEPVSATETCDVAPTMRGGSTEASTHRRTSCIHPPFAPAVYSDIAPVNLFPPSSNYQAFAASQWVYDTHYNAWRDWIGDSVNQTTFSKHVGSYAVTVQSMDLRLISM